MEPESPLAMKNPPQNTISATASIGEIAADLLEQEIPACLVRIEAVSGSAPREAGTVMLVSENSFWGTIGGGQLEWVTLAKARDLLAGTEDERRESISLGPEINQCCGGRVDLYFGQLDEQRMSMLTASDAAPLPKVQIHGAGHTGHALARALSLLPLEVVLVDTRPDALADLPTGIAAQVSALPEQLVREAATGTAFVVLTHSHDLDFLIAAEALSRGDAAYVGMIGSRTKRAVFAKWLGRNDYEPALASRLVCPIGGSSVRDKRPEVIAALVAAELLRVFADAREGRDS